MYTHTWNKYLPVIRILLKRAITEDQRFQLNTSDFQKAATVRKTGHKFTISFVNGKSEELTRLPEIAKDLSSILMGDPATKELLRQYEFTVSLDTSSMLTLKRIGVRDQVENAPVAEQAND